MGKRDPRVDAYIRKAAPFARPILERLREAVHAGAPQASETIKWGMPFFELDGIFCNMAAFKAHATFGFWATEPVAEALAEAGLGSRAAMGHLGRIGSVSELPPKRTLTTLMRRAAAAKRTHPVKKMVSPPKPPLRAPADLLAALRTRAGARKHFDAFPPGKRRDYIEWVLEAKTEATRARRIATAVQWIAEGKSRNWKYERR